VTALANLGGADKFRLRLRKSDFPMSRTVLLMTTLVAVLLLISAGLTLAATAMEERLTDD
jgi:hypothetical protein